VQLTLACRALVAAGSVLALAGCATPRLPDDSVPPLRLAPALLGQSLALQQHITLSAAGHEQQMDVLLEADAAHVQLAIVAMGQVAARIGWDGQALTEWRASWWPASVSSARILNDMQLSLWPLAGIQAALPAGWQATEVDDTRTLSEGGVAVTVVRRVGADVIELDQRRDHYRLTIVSLPIASPAP
jgi:hypothetical protein